MSVRLRMLRLGRVMSLDGIGVVQEPEELPNCIVTSMTYVTLLYCLLIIVMISLTMSITILVVSKIGASGIHARAHF